MCPQELDANADNKIDATLLPLDTDLSSVSDNDDTVPSAKATKAALDAKLNADGGTISNYAEEWYATTTAGNVTIDLANGMVQRFILDAARQFTMPADPGAVGKSFVLILECATYTPTWAASPVIEWLTTDGAAPTLVTTVNLVNVLTFIWDDVDSRWLGFLAGKETA